MAEVDELPAGVDPQPQAGRAVAAVGPVEVENHPVGADTQITETFEGEFLLAGERVRRRAVALGNSRGRTPMPIRLLRWMRSYDSATPARTPSSAWALAAQSRLEPAP